MSSTSPKRVSLYGDFEPRVGTNPWTFSLPISVKDNDKVVVDLSLAELTHGKCLNLIMEHKQINKNMATLPYGKSIGSAKDLWKNDKWNAIIHPIGGEKAYKSFDIMWSLQLLGTSLLGLNENGQGTFIILISPYIWEPQITEKNILSCLNNEINNLKNSNVAHIPGIKRSQKRECFKENILIPDKIAEFIGIL